MVCSRQQEHLQLSKIVCTRRDSERSLSLSLARARFQVQQMNTYSNMPLFATMVVRRGLSQAIKEGSVAPVQVPEAVFRVLSESLGCSQWLLVVFSFFPMFSLAFSGV